MEQTKYLFRKSLLGLLVVLVQFEHVSARPIQVGDAADSSAPSANATYLWSGTIHAQSTYSSQESDGSPGKHFWTRSYSVMFAEVPTTSLRPALDDGNSVSWPINDLIPLQLSYEISAFTDDRPFVRGPAHGGFLVSGTAEGSLKRDALYRDPNGPKRAQGSLLRLVAPQESPSFPATWPSLQARAESVGTTTMAPGSYEIYIEFQGAGFTSEETYFLYDGITVTHQPSNYEPINADEEAELATPDGFLRCMVLDPVVIFGVLEQPDQEEVSGSHSFAVYEPDPGQSAPQVLIAWNFRRTPYQPVVSIEYRQQQIDFVGPTEFLSANEFSDFLVGHAQGPIEVRITTLPEDYAIQWTIEPEANYCGTVAPNQGTAKEFSFTPNVQAVRPTAGAREPNPAIAYIFTVRNPIEERILLRETIRQDTICVMRQEYVDYRRQTPRRNVNFGLIPPARELFSPDQEMGPSFTFEDGRDTVFGNYLSAPMTLNGGWRDLAMNTQRAYGGVVDLNSAYRNPQRNTAVDGSATSIHMTGGAIDMDMSPQTAPAMVRLHRAALSASGASEILLERAGGGAGGTLMFPKNWNPPPATHSFVVGNAAVVVEDSDGDDLPDRVSELIAEPRGGIRSNSNLVYSGGGTANPNFQIVDSNNNGRIDLMEGLVLVHPLNGRSRNSLIRYYQTATHVHCATAELPREQGQ
jgi:hypothetical protein